MHISTKSEAEQCRGVVNKWASRGGSINPETGHWEPTWVAVEQRRCKRLVREGDYCKAHYAQGEYGREVLISSKPLWPWNPPADQPNFCTKHVEWCLYNDEQIARKYNWLRSLGWKRDRLALADCNLGYGKHVERRYDN